MNKELRIKDREIRWLIDEKYGGVRTPEAEKDIERLESGEHVSYVIGHVPFLGAYIDLSKRPLIPRVETEYWVKEALAELEGEKPGRWLDIFAGSGCIGVAALKRFAGATVVFGEKISLDQIAINIKLNHIDPARYEIIETDVFSHIRGAFDVIFANPPYVAESRRSSVAEPVLTQEPHEALFAGDDGLFYIKKLIEEAPGYLNEPGILYFEFDAPQHEAIKAIGEQSAFKNRELRKDQYGEWRWARFTL